MSLYLFIARLFMKWNCGDFEIHVRYELLIIERILRLKYHAMCNLELVNVTISKHKVKKLIGNKFCEIPTKSKS